MIRRSYFQKARPAQLGYKQRKTQETLPTRTDSPKGAIFSPQTTIQSVEPQRSHI